jgi:hypothetical protein
MEHIIMGETENMTDESVPHKIDLMEIRTENNQMRQIIAAILIEREGPITLHLATLDQATGKSLAVKHDTENACLVVRLYEEPDAG